MHIYFSGIGGTGIGPLALIAKQAGYQVSGSDKQDSQYIHYLHEKGIETIAIGQSTENITAVHAQNPIDWIVFSSAVFKENAEHPELLFAQEQSIKISKRDEFLCTLLEEKGQQLIAIAGTHGKTTTTAMVIWLMQQMKIPISYSVGAKTSFADMGHFDPEAKYFIYECDEYDRNFLAFHPSLSIITGVTWDHQDVFPTRENYQDAFRQFISQSGQVILWDEDNTGLNLPLSEHYHVLDSNDSHLDPGTGIELLGLVNRRNAWQVVNAVYDPVEAPLVDLVTIINRFPGVSRRFEALVPNLYTDYAHTSEKIRGAVAVAREASQHIVIVYEGLHNRRQHFMLEQHHFEGLFEGAEKVYWVPSYLAREDPTQEILTPHDLIKASHMEALAEPAELGDDLSQQIQTHLKAGDLVLCISAGGGGSLDEWLRIHASSWNIE